MGDCSGCEKNCEYDKKHPKTSRYSITEKIVIIIVAGMFIYSLWNMLELYFTLFAGGVIPQTEVAVKYDVKYYTYSDHWCLKNRKTTSAIGIYTSQAANKALYTIRVLNMPDDERVGKT